MQAHAMLLLPGHALSSRPRTTHPRSARTQGLSNLVWALAVAGVRPSGAWLSQFWSWMEVEEQLHQLSGQDMANIFW